MREGSIDLGRTVLAFYYGKVPRLFTLDKMGYFANSIEAQLYEERFCNKCIHYNNECPILFLHGLWNYEAVGKNKDETKETTLNSFIPRDGKGKNEECLMFIHKNRCDLYRLL